MITLHASTCKDLRDVTQSLNDETWENKVVDNNKSLLSKTDYCKRMVDVFRDANAMGYLDDITVKYSLSE